VDIAAKTMPVTLLKRKIMKTKNKTVFGYLAVFQGALNIVAYGEMAV